MNILQRLVLALAWMGFHSLVNSTIEEHPPVLEGSNVTLTCSGTTQSRDRGLYWQVVKNQTMQDAVRCDPKCDNSNTSQFYADIWAINNSFISNLTIKNITNGDRDTLYRCTVHDQKQDTTNTILEVKLSTIVVIPDNPICEAREQNDVSINISCTTSRVYPDLVCELHNENHTVIMSTKYQPIKDSAACSVVLPEIQPGLYSFRVTMFPTLKSVADVNTSVSVQTNTVNISSEPSVKLGLSSRCIQKSTPVNVRCRAYWVPSIPKITLYIGSNKVELSEMNTSYKLNSTKFKKFESDYQIIGSADLDGKKLKCVAVYANLNTGLKELHDKDDAVLIYSPQEPPIFKYDNGERVLENELLLTERRNITIICELERGNPDLSSTELVCKSGSAKRVVIQNSTGVSVQLEVAEKSSWQCTCHAQYDSQCDLLMTTLTVSVDSDVEWSLRPIDNTETVFYIFIALICLFVAAVLLYFKELICFKCPRAFITIYRKPRQWNIVHTNTSKVSDYRSTSQTEDANAEGNRALRIEDAPDKLVSLGTTDVTKTSVSDVPAVPPRTFHHLPTSGTEDSVYSIQVNTTISFQHRNTPEQLSHREHGVYDDRPALPAPRLPKRR